MYILFIKSPFFQPSDIVVASDLEMCYLCISLFEIPANRINARFLCILFISVSFCIRSVQFFWHIVRLVIFPPISGWVSPAVASLPAKLRRPLSDAEICRSGDICGILYTSANVFGVLSYSYGFLKVYAYKSDGKLCIFLIYRYHPVSVQQLYDSITTVYRTF